MDAKDLVNSMTSHRCESCKKSGDCALEWIVRHTSLNCDDSVRMFRAWIELSESQFMLRFARESEIVSQIRGSVASGEFSALLLFSYGWMMSRGEPLPEIKPKPNRTAQLVEELVKKLFPNVDESGMNSLRAAEQTLRMEQEGRIYKDE